MEALFLRVLSTACVISALLAVLLFPARRWMQRRYAPQVRWGLWCSLAGLLLFGACFSGFAALPETRWEVPACSVALPAVPVHEEREQFSGESAAPLPESVPPAAGAAAGEDAAPAEDPVPEPEPPAQPEVTVPLIPLVGALWLTGAVGVFSWQGIRYGRRKRWLLAASASTGAYEAAVREAGVHADVRILPGLECPLALGVFRPVVLVPDEKTAPLAVRHELTHIKRHDLAGKALVFAACALYWFDPLVWRMARVAGEDMEAACDAQLTRDMTAAEKRNYAELLLSAAAGPGTVPLSTRFGGTKEQMKSRLTQLFRPGRTSRALTGALLCAAFLLTALVACQSGGGRSALAVEKAVLYASFAYDDQPEDTDYRELTLTLVDFVPGADWVGGSYDTVTVPVAEDVQLDGIRVTEQEWEKRLMNFLYAPMLRSYALPGTTSILRVEVESGAITAMDWYEGVTYVGGVLWQDADYGGTFPFVLRLPGSWRNAFDTVAALGQDGDNRVTSYSVEFYRKGTKELLFTLEARQEAEFRAQYGSGDEGLGEQGIWMLDSVDGWCFYAEISPDAATGGGMLEDLLAQDGEAFFYWLGPGSYTSTRYGFTLELPDSWRGRCYAEETLQGVDLFYQTDGALLCSLIVRTEAASQEELDTDGMKLAGSENGWYVYLSMPQSVPANLFADMADGLRYQRMYEDFQRLFEEAWQLTFAQGADAVLPSLPPAAEPDPETRAAFAGVLRNVLERGVLPDGRMAESLDDGHAASNSFAVADVDGDGKEELVLSYVTATMGDMCGYVIGYDAGSRSIRIQLMEFPSLEFYENGAVKAMLSHNHSLGQMWPYTLYRYQPETDSYRQEARVMSWDKSFSAVNDAGAPFPDQADSSGTGTVYYVERPEGWYQGEPMDQADYLIWEAEALGSSPQLTLRFFLLTEENIAALER